MGSFQQGTENAETLFTKENCISNRPSFHTACTLSFAEGAVHLEARFGA